MRGGHEQLRPFEEVVLLWVVLEDHTVVVASRPVGEALQNSLVVLKCTLWRGRGQW